MRYGFVAALFLAIMAGMVFGVNATYNGTFSNGTFVLNNTTYSNGSYGWDLYPALFKDAPWIKHFPLQKTNIHQCKRPSSQLQPCPED